VDRGAGPGAASFHMINGMKLALALGGGLLALGRFKGHHFAATVLAGLASIMAVFAVLTYLTTIHALCSSVSWPALPSCRRTSLRRRYRFASRNDAHTPHARPFWQLQVMFGCAIIMPLLPFGRFPTLSVLASPCMARSCA
jgi:hypothetical protein